MYADDNTYICYHKSLHEAIAQLKKMLSVFHSWFINNNLCLNISKTIFMNITPRNSNLKESFLIKLDRKSIAQVNETKLLGIHLDSSLNWNVHINELCNTLSLHCFALYRLNRSVSHDILLSYYYAHIFSRLKYGIIFWGAGSLSIRVLKMQKRAVRSIVAVSCRHSCRPLFKKINLLTVSALYILETIVYVKKNINNFVSFQDVHNYETRMNKNLVIPRHCLSTYERSPYYMGIKLFNKLPLQIRNLDNLNIFKRKLRSLLVELVPYSINEYMDTVNFFIPQ